MRIFRRWALQFLALLPVVSLSFAAKHALALGLDKDVLKDRLERGGGPDSAF